jgi:hypothetical protein
MRIRSACHGTGSHQRVTWSVSPRSVPAALSSRYGLWLLVGWPVPGHWDLVNETIVGLCITAGPCPIHGVRE